MEINSLNTKKIIDLLFPVGCFFETTNIDFDPNISWGGTWIQDTKGYVTVGADLYGDGGLASNNLVSLVVGETTGEAEHTLTVAEMPSHGHRMYPRLENSDLPAGFGTKTNSLVGYSVEHSSLNEHNVYTGGSQSHNNVQPSYGVIRWHRTA